jgi:hypothetical protein
MKLVTNFKKRIKERFTDRKKLINTVFIVSFSALLIYPLMKTLEYSVELPHFVQFGTELFMHEEMTDFETRRQLDFLKERNITYVKLKDFRWDKLQPSKYNWNEKDWNWSFYDYWVDYCVERDFRMVGMTACLTGYSIEYITSIPDWVQYWIFDGEEIQRYANYTKMLVQHYKDDIHEWQIGNEVDLIPLLNHKRGGQGGAKSLEGWNATEVKIYPQQEHIVEWYKVVSAAVKEIDPEAEVHINLVVGGNGWYEFFYEIINNTDVDVIGVDLYPSTIHMAYQEEYYIELTQMKAWIDDINAQLGKSVELAIGEFGYAADTESIFTNVYLEGALLYDAFACIQRCPVERAFFHQIFDKPPVVYGYELPGYEQNLGVSEWTTWYYRSLDVVNLAFNGTILPITPHFIFGSLARFVVSFFSFMGTPANYHPWLSPFSVFVLFMIARILLGVYMGLSSRKRSIFQTQMVFFLFYGGVLFGVLWLMFGAWTIKPLEFIPAYLGSFFLTTVIILIPEFITREIGSRYCARKEINWYKESPDTLETKEMYQQFYEKYGIKPRDLEKTYYPTLILAIVIILMSAYANLYGYLTWMFSASEFPWWMQNAIILGAALFFAIGILMFTLTFVRKSSRNNLLGLPPGVKTLGLLTLIVEILALCYTLVWALLIKKIGFLTIPVYLGLIVQIVIIKLLLKQKVKSSLIL